MARACNRRPAEISRTEDTATEFAARSAQAQQFPDRMHSIDKYLKMRKELIKMGYISEAGLERARKRRSTLSAGELGQRQDSKQAACGPSAGPVGLLLIQEENSPFTGF